MQTIEEDYDVVVCGGGLAGVSAAIAAARHGARTVLIQDRPVLGGNSSSEVRVTPHGAAAFHAYARETGIVAEALIEERARNHEVITENGWTNSVWDLLLYDMVMRTEGLTLRLNTAVEDAQTDGDQIVSITARVANAETVVKVGGRVFIDCTGDGTLGAVAGVEWRHGVEGFAEFEEPSAPEQPSEDTMGSSLHFKTVDTGRPIDFVPPPWAVQYDDESFFRSGGRVAKTLKSGYWWIEIGPPWHTIHGNEEIRHELTRHVLGIWDWYKNKDPQWSKEARNLALDWVGQVPGKRESRRLIGETFMTEHDLVANRVYEDEVAFGGWYIDLHSIGGLYEQEAEPLTAARMKVKGSNFGEKRYVGPFGIPLRALVSKDLRNLMFAGRNISASHVALGALRVQGTTAVMGQAVGTAAALVRTVEDPRTAFDDILPQLQQTLLRDGCFLPNVPATDAYDLAQGATVTASSEDSVLGVGPDSTSELGGLGHWKDYPIYPTEGKLERRLAQWVAVSGSQPLRTVGVCLSNTATSPRQVDARLYAVEGIWDYRAEAGVPLRKTTLEVPPGENHWIDWAVDLSEEDLAQCGYVRIDLDVAEDLEWRVSDAIQPGQVAGYEVSPGRHRRFGGGSTLSFRVQPPQNAYPASNVLTGVTRPLERTHQWRSAGDQALPQWIQLEWPKPQTLRQVQLTFPGHLLREYHACPPQYRDPQCAKDYHVEALVSGQWQRLATVTGNYQTRVVHDFEAISTGRLRVTVTETNGDPSAGVYEIRCYEEPRCTPSGLS
ncbi:FAD-dependent oxidoreductase [Phycicoccus sp. MAQZ13P-2]|uniref:FAD-dependent oxidoreductase n=1 Tax=Phycicoccus mangrovi TaxID=2840470 RepID=UPI001C004CCF|nr:FAD-dependent oxidoreductase [Phycicoccus mangrovi]MBT9273631.1 FAD-dependent oxidoreductase [Phycicoccus mangrovi]